MADVTRLAFLGGALDMGEAQKCNRTSDVLSAEDLSAGDFVYLSSTGVKKTDGAGAACPVHGCVARSSKSGEPVTVFRRGFRTKYADAGTLTLGTVYYLSATKGALATVASVGDLQGAAVAVSDTDIVVTRDFTDAKG